MTKDRKSSDQRFWPVLRVPPWNKVDVPPASMAFAEKRVEYLQGVLFLHPIRYLLACAYLQGINDCVEAHIRNPNLADPAPTGGES